MRYRKLKLPLGEGGREMIAMQIMCKTYLDAGGRRGGEGGAG